HVDFIWTPSKPLDALARAIMPLAFIFVVSGVLAPNPTAVMQDKAVGRDLAAILKITRHPVQWGILLWAVTHLGANGDVASIIFFGTFALLSGGGMVALDAKFRRRQEPEWQAFFAKTSYWPFGAIISGRNTLGIKELDWIAIVVGVILYVLMYAYHTWVAGVPLI
ncbi:MAG: NnrU family protein, partial [Pseudomonadales bacterium]